MVILDAAKLRVVAAEVEQQADRQLPVVEIGPQLYGVLVLEQPRLLDLDCHFVVHDLIDAIVAGAAAARRLAKPDLHKGMVSVINLGAPHQRFLYGLR
jgi:hypothetical protein